MCGRVNAIMFLLVVLACTVAAARAGEASRGPNLYALHTDEKESAAEEDNQRNPQPPPDFPPVSPLYVHCKSASNNIMRGTRKYKRMIKFGKTNRLKCMLPCEIEALRGEPAGTGPP